MKKKTIVFLVALSLMVLPVAAKAAEFTLGGYIKMEMIWDSTQTNKNLLNWIARNNDANMQHGRLKMTAENTRMHFTIKGPKVFGAETTGYIEWDFDEHARDVAEYPGSPHKARLGLRHAMFRLNWPETELMLGQYWSVCTEEIPETANFGAVTTAGQPFLRTPQIRLTQKFLGDWTASFALSEPENGLWGLALDASQVNNNFAGESSETPKVEGRIKFEKDLWGKAAFWGKPRPFSARVAGFWSRIRYRNTGLPAFTAVPTFDQNAFVNITATQRNQQYLENWMVEGSLFIPLLPTYSANLAGSASLLTQWFVGAGLDAYYEDFSNNSSYLIARTFLWPGATVITADRELMHRYGGFIQLQYYFTNQWFVNAVWGMNKAFGVDMDRWMGVTAASDPMKMNQHYYMTLWYQPVKALKFGLEYTYVRTDYFQKVTTGSNISDKGENHRMMFCGFFFF